MNHYERRQAQAIGRDRWKAVSPTLDAETRVIYTRVMKEWGLDSIPKFLGLMGNDEYNLISDSTIPDGLTEWNEGLLRIWVMPFHRTKYMNELNNYHRLLIRRFGYYYDLRLLIDEMHNTCRAIVNERRSIRLAALNARTTK